VNGWLWAAAVLTAALVPLLGVAVRAGTPSGLVALESAGVDASLVLLLLAEGTHSQSFATLGLVLAVMSFIGSIAFLRFLAQLRAVAREDE
jgi:multisubunit Na+/H+ antiporter MnhF subunit